MNLTSGFADWNNFTEYFDYSDYPHFPSMPGINEIISIPKVPDVQLGSQLDSSLLTEIGLSALIFGVAAPLNAITLFMQVRKIFNTDISRQQRMLLQVGLQLTIANLIILSVCCMGRAVWLYTYFWYGGDILCRLFSFSYALGQHLWSYLACAIAMDIFICIRMPIKASANTEVRSKVIVGSVWPISIAFSLPHLILRGSVVVVDHPEYGPLNQCYFLAEFQDIGAAYELYNQIVSFYIPFVLMTVCYLAAICSYLSSVRTQQNLQEGRSNRNASMDLNSCETRLLKSYPSRLDRQLSENKNASALQNNIQSCHRIKSSMLGVQRNFKNLTGRMFYSVQFKSSASLTMTANGQTETIQRQQSQKSGRGLGHRFVITAIVVVTTYVLTWCPGQIFALWRLACRKIPGLHCDPINSWEWLEVLLYTCTISNPFVYKFLHTKRKSKTPEAIVRSRTNSNNPSKALAVSEIVTTVSETKLLVCRKKSSIKPMRSFADQSDDSGSISGNNFMNEPNICYGTIHIDETKVSAVRFEKIASLSPR